MIGVGSLGPGSASPRAAAPDADAASPGADGSQPIDGRALDAARAAEVDAQAVLASVVGLGPITLGRLLATIGSARAILAVASGTAGGERLVEASRGPDGAGAVMAAAVARAVVDAAHDQPAILAPIRRAGLTVLTLEQPEYPPRLRRIELPPPVLFVHGSPSALAATHAVAVVGTRRPTQHGRLIATRISAAIARAGAAVVSGLAVGIDGAAHAAVLGESGATVAVLGGGHERLYPRVHRQLAEAIVRAGGAVVSELPPETEPSRGTFPRRNRIIAGLAEATVVVEAGLRSGALITAAWALEQGRDCFLVPGSPDTPSSAGCLAFLRECHGEARIVAGVPELLEDLGLLEVDPRPGPGATGWPGGSRPASTEAVLLELGPVAREVGRILARGATTADDIVARTGMPVATVLAALTVLEMHGCAIAASGRYVPTGPLASSAPARPPRKARRDATGPAG